MVERIFWPLVLADPMVRDGPHRPLRGIFLNRIFFIKMKFSQNSRIYFEAHFAREATSFDVSYDESVRNSVQCHRPGRIYARMHSKASPQHSLLDTS